MLQSDQELENTQRKLRFLEEGYKEVRAGTGDAHLRELEMESLKRLINQLKEEIARYETSQVTRH